MHEVSQNAKELSVAGVVARAGAIWFAAQIGYYLFLPTITGSLGYSTSPIQITLYYLFWLGIALYSFWGLYQDWDSYVHSTKTYIVLFLGCAGIVLYLVYVLPFLAPLEWAEPWPPPSELLSATRWYFLPKSIDILLQQLLVAGMVLSFAHHNFSLRATSIWCAILFGGAHFLLIAGSEGALYVSTFIISAFIASFIFPYFILRVQNGFLYSYLIHWLFYAVVIILARVVFGI